MLEMDLFEKYRIKYVLPFIQGHLLDVGCGYNKLVATYNSGVGVDVYNWSGVDVLIGDAAFLPFKDKCFDTVTVVAALNHIPNRDKALIEIRRVLADSGNLLITMINPLVGHVVHFIFRHDEKVRKKFKHGELKGMTARQVRLELYKAGFKMVKEQYFEFGLNRLYMAKKIL